MRDVDLNVKMFSSLPYGGLPDYQKRLENSAEFVYSATFWEPSLPYPGNREFVTAHEKEFNRAPALQSANAYAGCQLFAEAARRAGSIDSDKLRETLLKLRTKTILGDFAIDERGFQIAQKAVTTQWQDGKQVILWPDEVAAGKPRFPTLLGARGSSRAGVAERLRDHRQPTGRVTDRQLLDHAHLVDSGLQHPIRKGETMGI